MGKGRAPHKLMMPQRGPYEVISKNRGSYMLKELSTNVVAPFNAHLLRPYAYDPEHDDPRAVALKEKQAFDVEAILAHDGNIKHLSGLMFLVKWTNYEDSENSWEPWKELRDNPKLFEYLKSKKLDKLIPKKNRI